MRIGGGGTQCANTGVCSPRERIPAPVFTQSQRSTQRNTGDASTMSREQVEQALTHRKLIAHWCARQGVVLYISPDGNMWRWLHPNGKKHAEWWVCRGKLAFDGKQKRAVTAAGAIEALREVEARWYPAPVVTGARVGIELDPVNAPGVFTEVPPGDLTGTPERPPRG